MHRSSLNPIFENCKILAPDGALLSRVGSRRAKWYVSRNLARVVSDKPLIIQLNFEPKSRTVQTSYCLLEKKNQCVVCGSTTELTRHHCVPTCYRTLFASKIKDHNGYDILVLCSECHTSYENHATLFKKQIAEENNVEIPKTKRNEAKRIRNLAICLLNESGKIPETRITEIKELINNYAGYKVENLQTFIEEFKGIVKPQKSVFKEIVNKLSSIESLEIFIRRWREHFIKTMNPKFMPDSWRIDGPIFCD